MLHVFEAIPLGGRVRRCSSNKIRSSQGVQGMTQSEMWSVGFGSRVPEVYHIARCASDTLKVSKTFENSRHAWGYLHPYRTGTACGLHKSDELVNTCYRSLSLNQQGMMETREGACKPVSMIIFVYSWRPGGSVIVAHGFSELLVTGFLTVTARSSEGWTRYCSDTEVFSFSNFVIHIVITWLRWGGKSPLMYIVWFNRFWGLTYQLIN